MKIVLLSVLSIGLFTACAKERPSKEKDPNEVVMSANGGVVGDYFVNFQAPEDARVYFCSQFTYTIQVEGDATWREPVDRMFQHLPHVIDGKLQAPALSLGCDVDMHIQLHGSSKVVETQQWVQTGTQPAGEEGVILAPNTGITPDTLIPVYVTKKLAAFRFNFKYERGEKSYTFDETMVLR